MTDFQTLCRLLCCIVIQGESEFMELRIIKSVNNAKFRVHMDNMKKVVFDDSAAFSASRAFHSPLD